MDRFPATILLHNFSSFLISQGKKETTVCNLTGQLKSLLNHNVVVSCEGIRTHLQNHPEYSSSSINNIINLARNIITFCEENNLNYDPGLHALKFVKDKYRPRSTMSDKEIESFLSLPRQTNTGKVNYLYWKTYFSILAYTGMRTIECAKLQVKDIDFSQGIFYLIDTKTNENRLVPIPQNILTLVTDWVNYVGKGYLFYSNRPEGHTSSVEWGYQFHVRIKRLNINRPNLTPYSLRHSYITEMLQTEGVNLFDVKNLVGHHDTKTTENYYHLSTKRLKQVVGKHPSVIKSVPSKEIFKYIEDFIDNLSLSSDYFVEKNISEARIEVKVERKPH